MAIAIMLRRAASAAAPPVAQAMRSQKYRQGSALLSAVVNRGSGLSRRLFPSAARHYSSRPSSDDSLLGVLYSEIRCAEESNNEDQVDDAPEGFPFEIEDNPGQKTISLTRKYQDETITVKVRMPYGPYLVTGEEEDDDDDNEKGDRSSLPLVVKVSKRKGPSLDFRPIFEFSVTALADEISIDSLSFKDPDNYQMTYEGPDFSDLDENLQKAFHKYLEIRGIKPSIANFLHEYMVNKDSKEYLLWLKNVKEFVKA